MNLVLSSHYSKATPAKVTEWLDPLWIKCPETTREQQRAGGTVSLALGISALRFQLNGRSSGHCCEDECAFGMAASPIYRSMPGVMAFGSHALLAQWTAELSWNSRGASDLEKG